ncbi:Ig-like domain-containing protein [Pseudenhygromyxa sp. WMMC2535]|uniref:Ig-like domain-containing protein n=1 Tax=Pseudenhygromyxa sp. WMMC2535 TaxID=2712867 RepID=UPI001556F7B0|nr:Ig-like domain-containing protein [Pseudenhygromyxa sp. WMMC2535]NVB37782.1 Ig-like domain-containing protein [Pseudenhygromyxa sp. WMMC2535]
MPARSSMTRAPALLALGLAGLLAPPAFAEEPGGSSIIAEDSAEVCSWPTTALAGFGAPPLYGVACGTTLIHPELIVVYEECVAPVTSPVDFGELPWSGAHQEVDLLSTLAEDACVYHPSRPFAVCRLAEPVDLPITPIVFGCETEIFELGRQVAMVGYGADTYPEGDGEEPTKRWGWSRLVAVDPYTLTTAEDQAVGCGAWDLGTPLYVRYPDGSWHVAGIATKTADCKAHTYYERLDVSAAWIEDTFGLDVTPCHDIDGTWNPSDECQNLSQAGPTGTGTWDDWCEGTPAVAYSQTCGPNGPDVDPTVVVTSPADQAMLASGEGFDFEVSVNHPVTSLEISIDGNVQAASDETWPFGFGPVMLADGEHTLIGIAHGGDGETRMSEAVVVYIGAVPSDDSDSDSGDEGETGETGETGDVGSEEDGDETGDGLVAEGEGEGCACEASRRGSSGWALLPLLLLFGPRSRRFPRSRDAGSSR